MNGASFYCSVKPGSIHMGAVSIFAFIACRRSVSGVIFYGWGVSVA